MSGKKKLLLLMLLLWMAPIWAMICFKNCPSFSKFWLRRIILPFSDFLHSLTSALTFPVFEIAAIVILIRIAFIFFASIKNIMHISKILRLVWLLALSYCLLWYPAYWAEPPEHNANPSSEVLAQFCEELILDLNAASLSFPAAEVILNDALQNLSQIQRAKFARYPEWMNYFNIAGFYSPWTGEIIINPQLSSAAMPFTVLHELSHLSGIADEGAANIAAWQICISSEGYFKESAQLWALKYAMHMLSDSNSSATAGLYAQMSATLRHYFQKMGDNPATSPRLKWLGLSDHISDYNLLIGYLLDS